MYAKSDNKEFVTYDNANGIVDELQKKPLSRYQDNLETSIRDRERERKRERQRESNFIFGSVQLLYYK